MFLNIRRKNMKKLLVSDYDGTYKKRSSSLNEIKVNNEAIQRFV